MYLLDTHTLLWFLRGDSRLSAKAEKIISSTDSLTYVSCASFWEITISMKLAQFGSNLYVCSTKPLPGLFSHRKFY